MGNEHMTDGESEGVDEKFIHVRVSHDFKTSVRVAAAKRDESISDYVRQVLRDDFQATADEESVEDDSEAPGDEELSEDDSEATADAPLTD